MSDQECDEIENPEDPQRTMSADDKKFDKVFTMSFNVNGVEPESVMHWTIMGVTTWGSFDATVQPDEEKQFFSDQEELDDSQFRADSSGFTLSHFAGNTLLLDRLTKPLGAPDATIKLHKWFVVHEPRVAPGVTTKERMARVGREYNGVAFNPVSQTMDVFRYDVDDNGECVPKILNATQAAKLFGKLVKSEAFVETVLETKNKRLVDFFMPYTDGLRIKTTHPYVPQALYKALVKKREEAAATIAAAAAAAKIEEDAIETDEDTDAANSIEEPVVETPPPTPQVKKSMFKKVKRPAVAAVEPPAKRRAVPKEMSTKHDIESALAAMPARETEPDLPRVAVRTKLAEDNAKENVGLAFLVMRDNNPRLLKKDEPLSLGGIVNHVRHKMGDGYRVPEAFNGIRTLQDVAADTSSRYTYHAFVRGLHHFAPHLFGLVPAPDVPESYQRVDEDDLF